MQLSSIPRNIYSSISSAISNFGSKLPTLTAKQKQISLIAVGILAAFTAIWAVRRYFNKTVTPAAKPTPNPTPNPTPGNDVKDPATNPVPVVIPNPGSRSGSSSIAANGQ